MRTEPHSSRRLRSREVHLWQLALDVQGTTLQRYERLLDGEERERAQRFRFPALRARFILCRGALRELLAAHLGIAAQTVRFCCEGNDKPVLLKAQNPQGIQFNLSHSGEVALIALARRRVGVDVERIDERIELQALSRRILREPELRSLRGLASKERLLAFFRYWTLKEAYLKALGEGITGGMRNLEVRLGEGDRHASLRDHRHPGSMTSWCLLEVAAGVGYTAAIAVEREDVELRCFRLKAELDNAG